MTRPPAPAGVDALRAGDELAAVDADDLAVDEVRALARQGEDRVGDVLRRGHPAGRVPLGGRRDDHVVLGDLHQGRGHGHAGPDRVGRDPLPRLGELHGQLPDVRLEGRLRRRDDAVRRHDPRRALRGHREDLRALLEEPAAIEVLDPVDEAVGHDVLGHLHLLAVDGGLRVVGDVGHERAEGQRMHHDSDVRVAAGGLGAVEPLAQRSPGRPRASRRRRRSC